MRVSLLLSLSYLYTAAFAGGYQECLGRIWMYQAYQIDALNDESSRTIGFKCKSWNFKDKLCNPGTDQYTPCSKNGRCNFDQWSLWLGKTNLKQGWAVYQSGSTERLNIDETAKVCYKRFITDNPNIKKSVPGPPPFSLMKGVGDIYNDQIKQVSKLVNDAYSTKRTSGNQHLWDDLDEALKKIVVARAGDHGPFVIQKARDQLGGDLEIKTEDLGDNSGSGEKWEKVDWEETLAEAERKGVKDADKKIRDFLFSFYRDDKTNNSARAHLSVIKSFKRARDRDVSCR